jgi:hypothetical protein
MFLTRWIPTIVAFPVGGAAAIAAVGSNHSPVTAALGGLIAGAVIGIAQWLALRPRGVGPRWALLTAAGMAGGSALAAAVTDTATSVSALAATGLVIGVTVGAAQAMLLGRGPRVAASWTTLVGLTWATGWLISGNVIVDAERGYYIFGLSGALLVTVATGLALRWILAGDRIALRTEATPGITAPAAATR